MTDIIVAQSPVNAKLQGELKKAISAIDRRIKSLGGHSTYLFKAIANFKYNELDPNNINVQTCQDLPYLIKSLSKMKRVEREYNATMQELKVDTYPVCNWQNIPISAWIEDLTYLVKRLSNKTTLDTLTQKRAELQQFMSAEEKLVNILESLKTVMK